MVVGVLPHVNVERSASMAGNGSRVVVYVWKEACAKKKHWYANEMQFLWLLQQRKPFSLLCRKGKAFGERQMHCIVSNLKRVSKMSTLPPPGKNSEYEPYLKRHHGGLDQSVAAQPLFYFTLAYESHAECVTSVRANRGKPRPRLNALKLWSTCHCAACFFSILYL